MGQNIEKARSIHKIRDGELVDTIKIEFIENKILLPVRIGNEEKKYILDTGASFVIDEKLQYSEQYKTVAKVPIYDANNIKAKKKVVRVPELWMENIKIKKKWAIVYDLNKEIKPVTCLGVSGLIGTNVLFQPPKQSDKIID